MAVDDEVTVRRQCIQAGREPLSSPRDLRQMGGEKCFDPRRLAGIFIAIHGERIGNREATGMLRQLDAVRIANREAIELARGRFKEEAGTASCFVVDRGVRGIPVE